MSTPVLKLPVYSQTGEKVKELELNPRIFGVAVKESVVHQVAVAQMANSRQVLAHTKDKGEVRGGGRKPWRQKGTGRARHGSIRSPLWKGGGVTFGPTKERNFSQKVNKKMKRKALFMCLSDKVKQDWLILLDKLELSEGRTREMVAVLKSLKEVLKLKEIKKKYKEIKDIKGNKEIKEKESVISEQESGKSTNSQQLTVNNKNKKFDIKKYKLSLLVVLSKSDKKIFQAGRNLVGVKLTTADSLNVADLLKYKNVLMAEDGLKVIEKTYLKSNE